MGYVLFSQREEKFAQLVAQGIDPQAAKVQAGYPPKGKWSLKRLVAEPRINQRIQELTQSAANRAMLTKVDILEGIKEEWRLAREAAQHGAALKAAEMLGSELHGMFRKQLEIGRPGEFEGKSEAELREYIEKQMADLGLKLPSPPPLIEAQSTAAENEATDSK